MCMRILIVEDHEHTRHVLKRLLQRWGFDVASAPTLQNGLRFLEAGPFDAIVSDIALPDGTGYALVREAKRRWEHVLAIALSGYSLPGDINIGQAVRIRLSFDQTGRLPATAVDFTRTSLAGSQL